MRPTLFGGWAGFAIAIYVAGTVEHIRWLPAYVAAEVVFAVVWPLLFVSLFCLPALASGLVPRRWRMWWRRNPNQPWRVWCRWLVHRRTIYRRPGIPKWLRLCVYAADRGGCVFCPYADPETLPYDVGGLQLDHVRPWSCGGLSSVFNLITLCGYHNRIKSNYWVWPSGMVTYRPWRNAANQDLAAAILAVERRARWNPLRWYRAAWSLR